MKRWVRAVLGLTLAFLPAACSDDRPPPEPREHAAAYHPPIELLQRYDTDHDGRLSRAELEAGLKADFAAADTNHDGRLDEDETRAVNEQRWSEGQSTTSTLVDWNHDGFVDFNEFAGTARSLFEELDKDGDGVLSQKEMGQKPDGEHPDNPPEKPRHHR
jgi:Ca2+-binding EF-hand superfamily protein